MPRIRLDVADRDSTHGGQPERSLNEGTARTHDSFARIDTDVFSILSNQHSLGQESGQPRIERWLKCWSRR